MIFKLKIVKLINHEEMGINIKKLSYRLFCKVVIFKWI